MKEGIEQCRPKQWGDYPQVDTSTGRRSVPLILSMNESGAIHALPEKFGKELLEVEKQTLFTSYQFNKMIDDTLGPDLTAITSSKIKDPLRLVSGQTAREVRISALLLMNDKAAQELSNTLADPVIGLSLLIPFERGNAKRLYAYEDRMKEGTVVELFNELRAKCLESDEAKDHVATLQKQRDEIERLMAFVRERIRDPHPFWASVKQAVRDPFQ